MRFQNKIQNNFFLKISSIYTIFCFSFFILNFYSCTKKDTPKSNDISSLSETSQEISNSNNNKTTNNAIAHNSSAINNETSPKILIPNKDLLSTEAANLQTVYGTITFKFYKQHAPNTTQRIQELIKQKFYDGIVFHRVVPSFVVQTGDPNGTGTGGSGRNLPAEFNKLKHVLGTVAMARTQDINSADSQFYIALSELPHLDGQYTIFGQVTEGLEVLDKIKKGDKIITLTLSEHHSVDR